MSRIRRLATLPSSGACAAAAPSADCAATGLAASTSTTARYFHIGHFPLSSDRIMASVHVMSTLSPTFTLASAALSSTRVLYFQPFGPVKVIEGAFGSIAAMVAVIVRWCAAVPAVPVADRVTALPPL